MLFRLRHACVAISGLAATLFVGVPAAAAPLLSVSEAVREARARSPLAAEALASIDAERGRLAQARLRPNPEFDLEVENFAGPRDLRGVRSAETTGSLALPVELGGKRTARVSAATAGVRLAEALSRTALLDLDLAVRTAHAEAGAAEGFARLADEDAEIARSFEDTVGKLVTAGREPPLRQVTAATERAQAEAAARQAGAERVASREGLAALIGRQALDFEVPPPDLGRVAGAGPEAGPAQADLDAAARQIDAARGRLAEARSFRTPDVRLSLGARRLAAEDATALVAGVAIPFPLFNRNGGNIAAATAEVRGAEAAAGRRVREAEARLAAAKARAEAAQLRFQSYDREVVPGAAEALRIARLGYAAGRFPYVDLLQAQRGYAFARRERLVAARDAQIAAAERDRAAGLDFFGDTQ